MPIFLSELMYYMLESPTAFKRPSCTLQLKTFDYRGHTGHAVLQAKHRIYSGSAWNRLVVTFVKQTLSVQGWSRIYTWALALWWIHYTVPYMHAPDIHLLIIIPTCPNNQQTAASVTGLHGHFMYFHLPVFWLLWSKHRRTKFVFVLRGFVTASQSPPYGCKFFERNFKQCGPATEWDGRSSRAKKNWHNTDGPASRIRSQ